jgi:hypothetical protein
MDKMTTSLLELLIAAKNHDYFKLQMLESKFCSFPAVSSSSSSIDETCGFVYLTY